MKTEKTIVRELMSLIGLMGLILLLSGCSSSSDEAAEEPQTPVQTLVPISFSGSESQEEAVSNGGSNRAATRANRAADKPLHDAGVTQFAVWGYKNLSIAAGVYGTKQTVFPEYKVKWYDGSAATTTTNSSGWEYILTDFADQTIKYWDFSAKAYRFFGVTGTKWTSGDLAVGQYKTNEANAPYEITLSANASDADEMAATSYFSRLWFSDGSTEPGSPYYDKQFGKPVTLEFVKPYARARFLFKYAYPREGIKLSAISFKPTADIDEEDDSKKVKIARKGTVTIHYPKEGAETKEWYTMAVNSDPDPEVNKALTAFTEDYDPEDDGKTYTETDKGWYMVLPILTQGSYTLSVNVNGETKTAVVPAEYMKWMPGYSYTYIFKITDEGGVEIGWVEYAMTPWTEMEKEHTVYNW